MSKTIRIDALPASIQQRILALQAKGRAQMKAHPKAMALRFVTPRQLERALKAVEEASLGERKGWEQSNQAAALGRVMLRYFEENPKAKRTVRSYLETLQQTRIRVAQRGSTEPKTHAAA